MARLGGACQLHGSPSVGRRDDGVRTLEQHDRAALGCGVARPRELVAFEVEQAPEFPFVRRQHAGAIDRREQSARLPCETGQRVGIQHAGLTARKRGDHALAKILADPAPRSEQDRVATRILELPGESRLVGIGRHHHRRKLRGVGRERGLGTDRP